MNISLSESPLFGDLSMFNSRKSSTRSSGKSNVTATLESLLDRSDVRTEKVKSRIYRQIPFLSNKLTDYAFIRDSVPEPGNRLKNASVIKKFLIERSDTETHETESYVVTMISAPAFLSTREASQLSWLDRPNFTGIIFYHSVDGKELYEVNVYNNGLIIHANLLRPGTENAHAHTKHLLLPVKSQTKNSEYIVDYEIEDISEEYEIEEEYEWFPENTESVTGDNLNDYGGGSMNDTITAAIIVADRNTPRHDTSYCRPGEIKDRTMPKFGGGGGSYFSGVSGYSRIQKDEVLQVILNSDMHCHTSIMGGNIIIPYEHAFTRESSILCVCETDTDYEFDRWVGDLAGKGWAAQIVVNDNISATAYSKPEGVGRNRPCVDSDGRGNPLMRMEIAPSGGWNFAGGTYGKTRSGGNQFHNGIDIYAEIGTEVYAMYDGIVAGGGRYVTKQPMRDANNHYPEGYTGDNNDAGNRIYIDSDMGNGTLTLGYWHLQEGTPVAINPRTGEPFAPGDEVYQGELIGYTGRTGNATVQKAPIPHLHLYAAWEGTSTNPATYINGTIKPGKKEITNINCIEQ